MKKIILWSLASFFCMSLFSFKNLDEAQHYAARHEEYPDADNTDWVNPNYTSLYRKIVKDAYAWSSKVKRALYIQKDPLWVPRDFEEGLKKVITLQPKGFELIGGMVLPQNEPLRFVVWTDLRGSFHSFVRALTDLRSRNIIDNNFNITAKNTYLIINGNAVCGSPYILQTLTVIFALTLKNPEYVIYQRGAAQNKLIWETCGLGDALRELSGVKGPTDPIFEAVNTYIQAMPFALYIREEKSNDAVRISPTNKELDINFEQRLGDFAAQLQPGKFTWYSVLNKKPSDPVLKVRAIVEGFESMGTVDPIMPLVIDKRAHDKATIFHFLSSQTRAFRQIYRYFYDGYGMVVFNGSLEGGTFLLMSRDVRTQDSFKQTCYSLMTGKKFAEICHLYV
jgi:hypothetical protein